MPPHTVHMVKEIPVLNATRWFIPVSTKARHSGLYSQPDESSPQRTLQYSFQYYHIYASIFEIPRIFLPPPFPYNYTNKIRSKSVGERPIASVCITSDDVNVPCRIWRSYASVEN